MEERRKHPRYDVMYKVVYYTTENPTRKVETKSFNISLCGIGIKIKELIQEKGKIRLRIFDPFTKEYINVEGRLVWQSEFSNIGENRAGIEFTDAPWTRLNSLLEEI